MNDDAAAQGDPATPAEFERLSNPRTGPTGERIAFTIECQGGASADIGCAVAEVPAIVSFLVNVAVSASEQSGSEVANHTAGSHLMMDPMPARGIGFVPGRSAGETYLVIHTAAFDLTFSVPSSGLARLAPMLGQIGSTLSAGGSKQ